MGFGRGAESNFNKATELQANIVLLALQPQRNWGVRMEAVYVS